MFEPDTYRMRRAALRQRFRDGLLLFLGNGESPMNYAHNTYPFRQDASFLYYFGIDRPDLAGVLDVEAGRSILFGDDASLDDVVWTGPVPRLRELADLAGIEEVRDTAALSALVSKAASSQRSVHFLPQYRGANQLKLGAWLGVSPALVNEGRSLALTEAVIAQRSQKSEEEIQEIEQALEVTFEMHTVAMRRAKPGVFEREVVAEMEAVARAHGRELAYPAIFSKRGETLHNNLYTNRLAAGDIVVNDSGATSPAGYASDITRTLPVGGRFTPEQRAVYEIVLRAQQAAIALMAPGVSYRDVHLEASKVLAAGLLDLGFFRGDPAEIVSSGAHAICFPHGTGHMLGLDVHDMEALGEDHVGYGGECERSTQFGLNHLRLARALRAGNVVTVEPGIYMIPALIERWEAEQRHRAFIDYARFRAYQGFGGIRIEDDVLITENGARVLGKPIPKTVAEVEAAAG